VRSIIRQSVVLPTSAEQLYATYLDPALHSAATGALAPVTISPEPGSAFSAFGGTITGTILSTVAPRLIIQSWRSAHFLPTDPDSTLILSFTPEGDHGRIDLIHIDVPPQDFDGVTEGWDKYYWSPWKAWLAAK